MNRSSSHQPLGGIGVYRTEVSFDRAGVWLVQVAAKLTDGTVEAQATFEVFDRAAFPVAGAKAPPTVNRLCGDCHDGRVR